MEESTEDKISLEIKKTKKKGIQHTREKWGIYSSRIFIPESKRKLWTNKCISHGNEREQTLRVDQSKKGRDQTWGPLTTKWDEKKTGIAQKKAMWLSPFGEL